MTVQDALNKREKGKTKQTTKFQKAKYLKRWKGKDGKWQYKYPGKGKKKKDTADDDAYAQMLAQKRLARMKELDAKLVKESKDKPVSSGVYSIEGSPSSIAAFASADKDLLAYYVQEETGDPIAEIKDRIKRRKDGAFIYEETEDVYE